MRKHILTLCSMALVVAGFTGCQQSGKDDNDAGETAVSAVTPTATPSIPDSLAFTASDPKVSNWKGVGIKADGKLRTNGTAGYLMFGPYASLKSGTYKVTINGAVSALGEGDKIVLDATAEKGAKRLGVLDVTSASSVNNIVGEFQIVLPNDVTDLEIRVNVPASADMTVDGFTVTK